MEQKSSAVVEEQVAAETQRLRELHQSKVSLAKQVPMLEQDLAVKLERKERERKQALEDINRHVRSAQQ